MRNIILAVILVMGACFAGCQGDTAPPGTLQGTVTIGPIWPVERPGEQPPIPPEVYQSRKVMVYDKTGNKLIATIDLSDEGHYSIELPAGSYTVDINYIGIDHSSDVPREIQLSSGETVTLNIDIDTGIR